MSMALLGIFAAIRVNVDLPFAANQPVTTVIASASTMLAAYIAGIKRRRTGLVLGASVGLAVFALIAAASAVIAAQPASQQIFVKLIALISSGGIGGMAGVSKSFNKKKIKRP
jgi:putative membrane protein (TIGR04086 family)